MQICQTITVEVKVRRRAFCEELLSGFEEDFDLLERLIFTDEYTFQISEKVSVQNVIIWGREQPHMILEHIRDSHKVNVFRDFSCTKIYDPLFLLKKIASGTSFDPVNIRRRF
jgi:hypothetical protein